MQALRLSRLGSLDDLRLEEVPRPVPGLGEVLVQVRAAGLNPSDVKNVLGRFPYTTLPRIPGRDFAGVVLEGPEALVGTQVWGTGKELGFTRDGSHAACLVLPADGVAPLPDALDPARAASCGVPYTTAWDALERTGLAAGNTLLVIGAGAVGAAAISLGRWRGARVVAGVRRPEQAEALRERGIPALMLRDDLREAMRPEPPDGADVVFDTTGQWLAPAVAALVPAFGRIAVIAAPASGRAELPILDLYRRGGSVVGINSLLHGSPACARMLARIGAAFASGQLPLPPAPREVPFADAVQAYREVDRGASGKIVFTGLG